MKKFFACWFTEIACILAVYTVFVFIAAPAFAATALADASAGFLSSFVFPLLTAFLLGLVSWAVTKIGKKYKLEALLSNQKLIEAAALKGIGYAEEYAADRLKGSNVKITSNDKLNLAVAQVLKSVPSISADQARGYVQSVLGRITGAGATGANAVTVPVQGVNP